MRHASSSTTLLAATFLALTLVGHARGQQTSPAAGAPDRIKLEQGEVLSADPVRATAETVTVEGAGRVPGLTRGEVAGISQVPRRFDRYGDIGFDDEKARLDALVIELQNQPSATAYVEVYGIKTKAKRRADRIRDYLVAERILDDGRLKFMTCAGTKLSVEIWVVPLGGSTPKACSAKRAR